MDSSSSTSRFRFRDHQEMDDGGSSEGNTSSDIASVSSNGDEEPEVESMTGKGIKHLCSELLELKRVSDEDFHKTIFSNYSTFVRIFEEVEGMDNEVMKLKHHVSTQRKLVKDLIDGIYLKVLSKETLESITEGPLCVEPSPPSILKAHAQDVSDILDMLLSEHRLHEAVEILEVESRTLQSMQLQDNYPPDVLMLYNAAISERRATIARKYALVAENSRVSAPELQEALVGLCRLGDSHLATQLLLKYYHSRISSGILGLQYSKTVTRGVCIREVAKFALSMISQAARSFLVLHGETSSYPSEFIQWAREEIEVFAAYFNKYVKSISETSGGLLAVVEAVHFAMSYCSLLETQRIVLRPCLVKHICPCVEEVLQIHIDHFKKVICIFTSTETWVVGRYLVSGILYQGSSSMVIGLQPEYCLLTNSCRKFVTLLQAISEDISPLVTLQMEGSIIRGFMDLFTEFVVILEGALTNETSVIGKGGPVINLAESPVQQVSVIANLSTLVHFFSSTMRSVFKGISHFNMEIDSFILFIKEASVRARAHFCQQFICRIMSHVGGQGDSNMNDVMPSVTFQVLFLELRKIEKLAEDNIPEVDWLMELMKELMEAILVWIANHEDIWNINEEDLDVQHFCNLKQFVLDVQFLVEIARCGGYFSDSMMNASLNLLSRMESAFIFAGLNPRRDINDDGWAVIAAKEALRKLKEMEETKLHPNEPSYHLEEETNGNEYVYASDPFGGDYAKSSSENSVELAKDEFIINASEVDNTCTEIAKTDMERLVDFDGNGSSCDRSATDSADTFVEHEDIDSENEAESGIISKLRRTPNTKLPDKELIVGHMEETAGALFPVKNENIYQHDGFEQETS